MEHLPAFAASIIGFPVALMVGPVLPLILRRTAAVLFFGGGLVAVAAWLAGYEWWRLEILQPELLELYWESFRGNNGIVAAALASGGTAAIAGLAVSSLDNS